jgi:two-component system, OmpR family, sensor histidine kinase KdpD
MRATSSVNSYVTALLVVGVCTAANWLLSSWLATTNLAMVYLLGIVLVAVRLDRGPSITAAIASVLAFDFLFVSPVFTWRFGDKQYLITGFVLLVIGIVISTFATRARAASQAALIAQEEQLRNSLLASISHDLRTPLALIAGSASGLRDEGSKLSAAEQRDLVQTIYDEAQHMSAMVNDLLDMTRLLAGRVALDRQWYPLEELVGAAIERCKSRLVEHHVRTRIDPKLPMVHVDGVLIDKLLVNLLENAAKYTPEGTVMTIAGELVGDKVVISVEDEGPGIPPGIEERVFEKFFRANPESSVTGSGLGLSICRAIAEMHGGRIDAANRPGGGAVFVLTLKAEQPPATESP